MEPNNLKSTYPVGFPLKKQPQKGYPKKDHLKKQTSKQTSTHTHTHTPALQRPVVVLGDLQLLSPSGHPVLEKRLLVLGCLELGAVGVPGTSGRSMRLVQLFQLSTHGRQLVFHLGHLSRNQNRSVLKWS